MKIQVTQIEYDTDEEEVDLPQKLTLNLPDSIVQAIDEFVGDEISNVTGFCHNGFTTNLDNDQKRNTCKTKTKQFFRQIV